MPLPFIPLILTPLVFAAAKKVADKAQAEADATKAPDAAAEIPEASPEPIVLEAALPLFPLTASSATDGHEPSLAGDSDLETFWQSAESRGWLQLTLPTMQEVQRVTLSEAGGEQIQLFAVEYRLTDDGQWRTLFAGEKIGALLVEEVPPTLAQAIRLQILASDAPPAIAEFAVA
ncbi:discoidin domain-containing protein [Armatimonas sp.]|uniref:discoidin domain-containing protein n=1 Tax=Armatimonas sp. TaxID=1872638 RepID=UPI0037519AB2